MTADKNTDLGGPAKVSADKSELVLVEGNAALTVEGMERIYHALTGKDFTAQERNTAQKKIDAQTIERSK